jgi:hypothetical protein
MWFDADSRRLESVIEADIAIVGPTELFVPSWRYPNGVDIALTGVPADAMHDPKAQILRVNASETGQLRIVLTPSAVD